MAKRYFADNEITYRERDVAKDFGARRQMVVMTGQLGVPVIQVGERAMVGWNAEEFERMRRNPRGER